MVVLVADKYVKCSVKLALNEMQGLVGMGKMNAVIIFYGFILNHIDLDTC